MLLHLSYLQFHIGLEETCDLVVALRNFCHVLVSGIIMLRKGTDTVLGNLT
jgi:hypothetical protein